MYLHSGSVTFAMEWRHSGVDVNTFIPIIVAFVVSLFTSVGGISGAFSLLPFQMSVLKLTAPSVDPISMIVNIVAIPRGVYRLRAQKYLPHKVIKSITAILVITLAARNVIEPFA